MIDGERIVITGVGLTAPNGNNLTEFRANLLSGKSGIRKFNVRYMGDVIAGVCDFDPLKYQKKKEIRRGTRAGSAAIYSCQEAVADAKLDLNSIDRSRIGIFIGITEHGNLDTEKQIYEISQYKHDTKFVSHHYNPRIVANNPAGEVTLNMGITGPHYTLGAACAGGNLGMIQGCQMLLLDEVDVALGGGVSETAQGFLSYASFRSEGALASHEDPEKACRPFDKNRNGTVVSEGGCIFVLERLEAAVARSAKIYGEVVGWAVNSDALDFILPDPEGQAQCMRLALRRAKLSPDDISIVSTHATGTIQGDPQECEAIRQIFGVCRNTYINNTKSMIGHAMGAAAALELAGNLPSFEDDLVHPTINVDDLDPDCALENLVINKAKRADRVDYILKNAFGMLGINSTVIVKRFEG